MKFKIYRPGMKLWNKQTKKRFQLPIGAKFYETVEPGEIESLKKSKVAVAIKEMSKGGK